MRMMVNADRSGEGHHSPSFGGGPQSASDGAPATRYRKGALKELKNNPSVPVSLD